MSSDCTGAVEEKGRVSDWAVFVAQLGVVRLSLASFKSSAYKFQVSYGPLGVEQDLMAREWESEASVLLCVIGP